MQKTKVIIDTDPGIGTKEADFDDGVALLLALNSSQIEVVGVTTVHGNVPVSVGTKNALRLIYLMKKQIKVAQGASCPIILDKPEKMKRPFVEIEDIPKFTPSMEDNLVSEFAPQFIVDTVSKSKEKITLICIGPLTNIALALIMDPQLKDKIDQIVIMGGAAFYQGNVTPVAEFNVWMDPEAAKIVFTSKIPKVMVGLNVTQKVGFTKKDFLHLKDNTDPLSKLFYSSATTWLDYLKKYNLQECYMHDAMAVAYLLNKDLLTAQKACVDVETQGILTRGQTIIDIQGKLGKPSNTWVCKDIDREKFHKMIIDCLRF